MTEDLPPLSFEEVRELRDRLIAKPFLTDEFLDVEKRIQRLHQAVLDVKDPTQLWSGNNRASGRALAVVAPFRFGKTFTVEQAINGLRPLPTPDGPLLRPICIKAPPTFDLEYLGRELLAAMSNLPYRSLGTSLTLEQVQNRIRKKRPTLIYIDEAQRMLKPVRTSQQRLAQEQEKIFGFLRDCLDLPGWPVSIVLTGTKELVPVLEQKDFGFFREKTNVVQLVPMEIGKKEDKLFLQDVLEISADRIGIEVDTEATNSFYDRLILASNRARGFAIEVCFAVLLSTAEARRKVVVGEDFATFYAQKTGAARAANPFVAQSWSKIDPQALLAAMPDSKIKVGDVVK